MISGIFYFIIVAGVLIFIHEGGHFLMAKLFKVKVQVFSLGMGPRIAGFKKGETDYRLSAVPIGGYVRLFGEDPTETVAAEERQYTVNAQPAWKRMLIFLAGPAMNLVFPVFLFFGLALGEDVVPPAEIGAVMEGAPAEAAGLKSGDVVTHIDGQFVYSFSHMGELIQASGGDEMRVTVRRDGQNQDVRITPMVRNWLKHPRIGMLRHLRAPKFLIGVESVYAKNVFGVTSGSPAARVGLRDFDRIEAVDGVPTPTLKAVGDALLARRGADVTLTVRHLKTELPGRLFPTVKELATIDIDKQPSAFEKNTVAVTLAVDPQLAQLADVGLAPSGNIVMKVNRGSVAEKIGLRKGDRLWGIDGHKKKPFEIIQALEKTTDDGKQTLPHRLIWMRDGQRFEEKMQAEYLSAGLKGELGVAEDRIEIGFRLYVVSREWFGVVPETVPNPDRVGYAWFWSVSQTLSTGELILDVLKSIFTGHISAKMMSGPPGIAHAAAKVSEEGASAFFLFMGFISLNLGLMNLLLPIPVLDGGRIVLVLFEVVMRRPLSDRVQEKIMITGAIMTLFLLVWAVIWDVVRIVVS